MNTNLKVASAVTGAFVVVIIVAIVYFVVQNRVPTDAADPGDQQRPSAALDSSHRLTSPEDPEVTVVEFLDFECEACGAAYPYVEDLRKVYGDRVEFVIRYFPLPGHLNSENAAVAVEAASRQGALEEMYTMMYETQIEWGEATESKAAVFRGYAESLGLDLAAYDEAVASPATLERVRADFNAGVELGVDQTPTFFVDDVPIELTSFEDIEKAIVGALED